MPAASNAKPPAISRLPLIVRPSVNSAIPSAKSEKQKPAKLNPGKTTKIRSRMNPIAVLRGYLKSIANDNDFGRGVIASAAVR